MRENWRWNEKLEQSDESFEYWVKPFLPFPSAQSHPSILSMSTSVMGLYSLSIQDLSAEDPALYLMNSLISTPKNIRAKPFYEIQRLTSLP